MVNFACSARLILALIGHSLTSDGYPSYHPAIAPVQVAVLSARSDDLASAGELAGSLGRLGIRARSYAGAGNLRSQAQRASRHGAPIVSTVEHQSVRVAVRTPDMEPTVTVVDLDGASRAVAELADALGRTMEAQSLQRRANMLRGDEGTGGKGSTRMMPLCDAAECVVATLDAPEHDVLGRPWKSLSSAASRPPATCHRCAAPTSLEVLLGQKVAGEK
jgi:hypothetical protein